MKTAKAVQRRAASFVASPGFPKDEFESHVGEYALSSGGVVDSFHASNREALIEALKKFRDGQFSIWKVTLA